jgi:1-acyl-sn-glycerol-3-phosphate acyltransferase
MPSSPSTADKSALPQSGDKSPQSKVVIYVVVRHLIRAVFFRTLRMRRHGVERGACDGGYILACAHVSHLDPFCLGALWPRRVAWMARVEFYRRGWSARALRWLRAFPVHRQGVPVSAIREALRRLAHGEVVGLFPEGEIMSGRDSVLRGGRIKRGVCLLAARSGRPVLPCLVLGTEQLNRVEPWLPAWRGRLWIAAGDFIPPVTGPDRRAARAQMAAEIERAFVRLYEETRARWQLADSVLP